MFRKFCFQSDHHPVSRMSKIFIQESVSTTLTKLSTFFIYGCHYLFSMYIFSTLYVNLFLVLYAFVLRLPKDSNLSLKFVGESMCGWFMILYELCALFGVCGWLPPKNGYLEKTFVSWADYDVTNNVCPINMHTHYYHHHYYHNSLLLWCYNKTHWYIKRVVIH
jgi:hypothetical protein